MGRSSWTEGELQNLGGENSNLFAERRENYTKGQHRFTVFPRLTVLSVDAGGNCVPKHRLQRSDSGKGLSLVGRRQPE